jgi:hypothetical protein
MGARIQLRRGKAAFWASENPILHSGEPGYETNTRKWKVGDGVTPWNDLPYSSGGADIPVDQASLADHISSPTPHPVYDDGPSLELLYENAKV